MTTLHEEEEKEWHEIGTHSICFEAPDIVHIRIVGDLTLPQVEEIVGFADACPKSEKGYFSLIDIPDAGKPNLEILKSKEIVHQMQQYRAFVYYRAQFKHRTVIEIVQKISRGLKLSLSALPLVAFATEAEARDWIDDYRRKNA